jgi:glycosyltransferase involved in cell wall biosynthesis
MASVSVAMATFNSARYLRQQLDSLAAQSHPPSETGLGCVETLRERRHKVVDVGEAR